MNTIDDIYNELKSDFESEAGMTLNDGGDMALRFRALAAQLCSLQAQAEFVQRQCFPQTATGETLDAHASQRGITRIPAVKAVGTLRFSLGSPAAADITVPEGTRCISPDEKIFAVTEDTVITAGDSYCDAPAEAELAGTQGNVGANSVIFMELPPLGVVSVTNPAAFEGGRDAESDEKLRSRVMASFSSVRNSGSAAYYIDNALAVDGVAAATVQPRYRGRGTVDVIIASEEGTPSQQLMALVDRRLYARKEICVDVQVKAPITRSVSIDAEISVGSGYDADAVCLAVENAIRAHFGGKLLGRGVRLVELGSIIYGVEGVENYLINTPAADVVANAAELPVLNTLSVSEA